MFLAVFTVLLNRDSEKIDNPEERQTKYKACQYSSDVAAVNTASSSSEQNRIVHILFCLRAHNVFVQVLIHNFFSLSHLVSHSLATLKKPCTGLNHMIHQLNKRLRKFSVCHVLSDKNAHRNIHILWELLILKPVTQGSLHLLLLILGISAFLIACAQKETNISHEDHNIFCIY